MTIRTYVLAGVMLAALITPADAGEGIYLGLEAGWSHPEDIHFHNVNADGRFLLDDGALFGGSVGYKWAPGIRLELEVTHAQYDVRHSFAFNFKAPARGDVQQTAYMANAAYDVPIADRFRFTVGGGVGAATISPDIRGDFYARNSDTRFAWQAMGGLVWEVTDRFDLQLNYLYRSVANSEHTVTNPCACTNQTKFYDLDSHSVMVGLRWYLEAVAPVVVPPPPPPPPPPPAVRNFIVFFDFNKSNLTAEAVQVIQEAVRTAMELKEVHITVTGHTDSVGSVAYNQQLSERRAEAVKNEMIREGLMAGDITTVGRNFSDPLVFLRRGIREPQNRRAVIDIQ